MLATLCKSCNTVNMALCDRCRWCGSRSVEVKDVDPATIDYSNGRAVFVKPKGLVYTKGEFFK